MLKKLKSKLKRKSKLPHIRYEYGLSCAMFVCEGCGDIGFGGTAADVKHSKNCPHFKLKTQQQRS